MNFDTLKMPTSAKPVFTSRYMEGMVKEEFKLLNLICENYSTGYLSESEALSILYIVGQDDLKLLETANDTLDTLDNRSLEEAIGMDDIAYRFEFVGEKIIPFKEIIKASEGKSLYNEYTFERSWDDTNYVGMEATKIADRLEANLKTYIESSGKEGFTEYEREAYATYPDNRVDRLFLYERVIDGSVLSGALTLEVGCVLKDFIRTRYMFEDVETMSPVIPLTSDIIGHDISDVSTKALVADVDAEASIVEDSENGGENVSVMAGTIKTESCIEGLSQAMRVNGAFIALENVVYKNNPTFDAECRKLFDKLQKDLKLAIPENPTESFKRNINLKKNRYTFTFSNMSADPKSVESMIISCGFKPIKEKGVVLNYVKTSGNIKITIEFTSIDSGIIMYYEAAGEVVKESSIDDKLEFAKKCDASDVKDAAKKVAKLREDKDCRDEDYDTAIERLNHAIENYKDVQKAKDVKESVSDLADQLRVLEDSREKIGNWNREINTYEEYVENINGIRNGYISLFEKESDEFVDERKYHFIETVNSVIPGAVNPYTMSHFIMESVMNAVSYRVDKAVKDVFDSIFNEEVTHTDFSEKVSLFAEAYKRQCDEEVICEKVLNAVEYSEYLEGSHDIDDDIKGIVDILERLGYKVKYSCSGHNKTRIKEDNFRDGVYHGKIYTTARITFDGKYNFKSVPKGWYENKNADVTSIYVRALSYNEKDGTPNEAFEKWKAEYMKALKDWVDHLGKSDEEDGDAKTESVISGIESMLFAMPKPVTKVEPVVESVDFDTFVESMMSDL